MSKQEFVMSIVPVGTKATVGEKLSVKNAMTIKSDRPTLKGTMQNAQWLFAQLAKPANVIVLDSEGLVVEAVSHAKPAAPVAAAARTQADIPTRVPANPGDRLTAHE